MREAFKYCWISVPSWNDRIAANWIGELVEVKPVERIPLLPEDTQVFEGDAPAEE